MEPLCHRLVFDALAGAHMLVGLHDMRGVVCDLCTQVGVVCVFLRELH